jgi:alpha-D-xyloside xylohydrolase
LKEGTIVPLLRPTVDTLAPTTRPELVDSYADHPGILYARLTQGPSSSFEVFDGTVLTQESLAHEMVLTSKDGKVFREGQVFVVVGVGQAPTIVTMDGQAVPQVQGGLELAGLQNGWRYEQDQQGGQVLVRVPSGAHEVRVHFP